MNIEAELKEIKQIEGKISELNAELRNKRQSIAEYACPFEVGQRVISGEGELQEIALIYPSQYAPLYDFKVYKIKKDGSAYSNMQYAYRVNEYTAAKGE